MSSDSNYRGIVSMDPDLEISNLWLWAPQNHGNSDLLQNQLRDRERMVVSFLVSLIASNLSSWTELFLTNYIWNVWKPHKLFCMYDVLPIYVAIKWDFVSKKIEHTDLFWPEKSIINGLDSRQFLWDLDLLPAGLSRTMPAYDGW